MTDADIPIYTYDEFAAALKKIRAQHKRGTKRLKWTGPTKFHYKTGFDILWHFTPEGIAYHAEHDRDFEAICSIVSTNFGYHQGIVKEERNTRDVQQRLDSTQFLMEAFEERWRALRDKYEPLTAEQIENGRKATMADLGKIWDDAEATVAGKVVG